MAEETKLSFINNLLGIMSILYIGFVGIMTFFFKEKSPDVLRTALPMFLIIAVVGLASVIVADYVKRKFSELESTTKRVSQLEEKQHLDTRLRKIEEKLISLNNKYGFMSNNKKGNITLYYILLVIVLLALIAWFVYIFTAP